MSTFDWRQFVTYAAQGYEGEKGDLKDRLDTAIWYARKNLKALGAGAARNVYLLNARSALKIAQDEGGIEQNRNEAQLAADKTLPVARVLKHDPGFTWIVSELVRPVKSHEEFLELAHYDIGDLTSVMEELRAEEKAGQRVTARFVGDPFLWNVWQAVKRGDLALIDVNALEHWGMTADRRLVLLDYGYTDANYQALPNWLKR